MSHEHIELVKVGATEFEVYIHETPTGGFWAEVPSMPWCATGGNSVAEVLQNVERSVRKVLGVES
jgi:predicted RNase H-like HicB family nuclease